MGTKRHIMTPSEILQKHEDANEYHLHDVDRKWIIEAMEEYAESHSQRLETLAKLLAKTWFYGEWEWENPNERIQQMIMQDLGYYPFKDEDEMICKTRVDENLYKEAVDKVALRNPRTTPIECHNSSNICDKEKAINLTAVEWLFDKINDLLIDFSEGNISAAYYGIKATEYKYHAKQMEKEQSITDYKHGQNNGYMYRDGNGELIQAEQYYNETYKSKP